MSDFSLYIQIICSLVKLFLFLLRFSKYFRSLCKTRQSSSKTSQQLNVIICKSSNKYETNWHETTAAWCAQTQWQTTCSGVVSAPVLIFSLPFIAPLIIHACTHTLLRSLESSLPTFSDMLRFMTALDMLLATSWSEINLHTNHWWKVYYFFISLVVEIIHERHFITSNCNCRCAVYLQSLIWKVLSHRVVIEDTTKTFMKSLIANFLLKIFSLTYSTVLFWLHLRSKLTFSWISYALQV